MERWTLTPSGEPQVLRYCSKCGEIGRFGQSGRFRVNANGRHLDVWLIYKCQRCDATWNLTILTRVRPEQIERGLLDAFTSNAAVTARRCAFDKTLLQRSSASPCYDGLAYTVTREWLADGPGLTVDCPFDFDLRLDRLLSDTLGLSRSQSRRRLELCGIAAKTTVRGTTTWEDLLL